MTTLPYVTVKIFDGMVSLDDELFIFEERLQEQVKQITYNNGYTELRWDYWRAPRRYFEGLLAE